MVNNVLCVLIILEYISWEHALNNLHGSYLIIIKKESNLMRAANAAASV